MIYFGLRSSTSYLSLLHDTQKVTQPHDIVSVIGGLAFLQGLSASCKSLHVLDTDPDAIPYAQMVITLIQKSPSLATFISYLTGHEVPPDWNAHKTLGKKIDHSAAITSILQDKALLALYIQTFGALRYDCKTGIGTIEESTIHFFGFDLTPMSFYWQFGTGIFKDEASFESLRTILNSIPIKITNESLDQIDYNHATSASENELFVLASNCDSPLFTTNDSILKQIQLTTSVKTTYLTWNRHLEIFPKESSTPLINTLIKQTKALSVYSIGTPTVENFEKQLASNFFEQFKNLSSLKDRKPYNADCLIIWDSETQNELHDTMLTAVPLFHRIIIVTKQRISTVLPLFTAVEQSYFISKIESVPDSVMISYDLRGSVRL